VVDLVAGSASFALDENGLPIHGVIPGQLAWKIENVCADGSALSASLRWDAPSLLEVFPFPHGLDYEARIAADSLTIAVTVHASGAVPVPVSFGFHPYLSIAGIERSEWIVELPVTERLVLDETMIPTGSREPVSPGAFHLADTSWDDAFAGLARPARFSVRSPRRTIAIDFLEGYEYAQVYSPSRSAFVCFEPMTSPTNALVSGEGLTVLGAGGSHRACFRLAVQPGSTD
jgi:galactose mutarotase-like enzyme